MINNVVLVGRLTKEPDLRYTNNGTATAKCIKTRRSILSRNTSKKDCLMTKYPLPFLLWAMPKK